MPELPEVETVRRGLQKHIIGKQIATVKSDWPKSLQASQSQIQALIVGAKITAVSRRAKVLILDLSSSYSLVIHLKMTGQVVYVDGSSRFGAGHPNDSLVSQLPDKSTRVSCEFTDKTHMYFNDQRKFGWIKLLPTEEVFEMDFFQKVGPEPLEDSFTDKIFIERIRKRAGSTIKAAILDQTVLAGVGNIYADEALYEARIHPAERVKKVSDEQLSNLLEALKDVMNLSIQKGGSSDKNYIQVDGKRGSYISFAKVFRKNGEPCQRDGTLITKYKIAGRGTHICKTCQTKPKDFSYKDKAMSR